MWKNKLNKEFYCKQCNSFLDKKELINSKCPNCNTDEDLFLNNENE